MANKITAPLSVSDRRKYASKLNPGQIIRSSITDSYWMVTNTHKLVDLTTGFCDPGTDPCITGDVVPYGTGLTLVVE